jgi:serine/threonine-protein kinase RsbT
VSEEIRLLLASDADVITARRKGREMAERLGFSSTDRVMIATAISELARNILAYARQGEIHIRTMQAQSGIGIEVVARDEGPGIEDLKQVMQGGYSTSGGLGLGLPGVRRLMDDFDIASTVGKGTTVTARKWTRIHGSR